MHTSESINTLCCFYSASMYFTTPLFIHQSLHFWMHFKVSCRHQYISLRICLLRCLARFKVYSFQCSPLSKFGSEQRFFFLFFLFLESTLAQSTSNIYHQRLVQPSGTCSFKLEGKNPSF